MDYCENELCESEATDTVNVAWRDAKGEVIRGVRHLCAPCREVFTWGVQYGRLSENPRAYEALEAPAHA